MPSLSSPSHLWLCQSLVSWITWGVFSPSLGHSGLKVASYGGHLFFIFPVLPARLISGYRKQLDFSLFESWGHTWVSNLLHSFLGNRDAEWLISPGSFSCRGFAVVSTPLINVTLLWSHLSDLFSVSLCSFLSLHFLHSLVFSQAPLQLFMGVHSSRKPHLGVIQRAVYAKPPFSPSGRAPEFPAQSAVALRTFLSPAISRLW